jgi:choice-of-anchor B domain-containing protein
MNKLLLMICVTLFCIKNTHLCAQNVNNVLRDTIFYQGQTCANVWGYVDSVGNEYALVGAAHGVSIVNVTNPNSIYRVKQIVGPNNLWKEIRTFGHYAYCTSEGGNGLQIINLRNLPDTNLQYHYWAPTINGSVLNKIHALHIDTATRYIYLYGCNGGFTGTMIAKLTDPYNPTYRGKFGDGGNYVHDGIVRNNMMYASQIYFGSVNFIDVSIDSLPTSIIVQHTPGNFTHNTWLSNDNKYLFTTDEIDNSYLTCYNVEDLQNIELMDKIQSNPGSNSVVHNTYYKDGYCFTSWYRDGYTIVDASHPNNLIQVGNYDAYDGSGATTSGTWGVYPYLPSGNVLLTNIAASVNTIGSGSLTVVTPTLQRACYLEGSVADSLSNLPLSNVQITATSAANTFTEQSTLSGNFATGTVHAGNYNITFAKAGYISKTINNVPLANGVTSNINIKLFSDSLSEIDEYFNKKNIAIFNTNNKTITINANINLTDCNIKMFDALGNQMLNKQLINTHENIDLHSLASGYYSMILTSKNGKTLIYKLVI